MGVRSARNAWKKWGEINPYFGVLSHDAYRVERLDEEVKQEFFRTGEAHIQHLFETIRAHLDEGFDPQSSVDFGCGTGRLVIPLSRRSAKVVGIDVSDAMIEEARRNCTAQGIGNVSFVTSVEALASVAPSYDFVHSFIVFQHIPAHEGMRIFEHLVRGLNAGGVLSLHFTIHRRISLGRKIVNWARHTIPGVHPLIQLLKRQPVREPPMQMNSYDLSKIVALLKEHGVHRTLIEITDHEGHLGAMILAKKQPL
jgi:2-polyprenyl-3-methyl-5-hydroxy-6-metoxy-1,4-benzoquinol methylase